MIFEQLEQLLPGGLRPDRGLDLGDVTVDGCIVSAPLRGRPPANPPWTEANSAPNALCWWTAAGSHWDAWSRRRTGTTPAATPDLEKLARFDEGLVGSDRITVAIHLDAVGTTAPRPRDLLEELGCDGGISIKGFPLQAGARWCRANELGNNRGFKKLATCTERHNRVIDALISLANAVIITRSLLRRAWTTHRWDTDPPDDPDPIRALSLNPPMGLGLVVGDLACGLRIVSGRG